MQHEDTPSPQSATLGLHTVAVATTHFPDTRVIADEAIIVSHSSTDPYPISHDDLFLRRECRHFDFVTCPSHLNLFVTAANNNISTKLYYSWPSRRHHTVPSRRTMLCCIIGSCSLHQPLTPPIATVLARVWQQSVRQRTEWRVVYGVGELL